MSVCYQTLLNNVARPGGGSTFVGMRSTIGVDWGTEAEPSYKSDHGWLTLRGRGVPLRYVTLPLMEYLIKKTDKK